MNAIFISFLFILSGGIVPLLMNKRFKPMKIASISLISIGAFWGMIFSLSSLMTMGKAHLVSNISLWKYFPFVLEINPLSSFFIFIISLISMLGAIYSYSYLSHENERVKVAASYFFYSVLTCSMILVVLSHNLVTFAFSWEIMSISSFFLVIYDYEKKEVRQAGFVYFIFAHIGAMFIFSAFGLIYAYTGSFSFDAVSGIPENIKFWVFLLAFIGFGSKAGLFPVHIWLPKAHPVAPSHVSAIMSGVMIKIGVYGILKTYFLLKTDMVSISYIVIGFGSVSGILGVAYALGQSNLKKLLAYSSAENVGIITLGLGLGMYGCSVSDYFIASLGFIGGLFHILNHSIFKSLLFLGAGSVLHQSKTLVMERMGGLMKNMRVTGFTFLIGSIAICGLPPFNGFVSEFYIYLGGFKSISGASQHYIIPMIAIFTLVLIGGLALACFSKAFGVAFLGNPRSEGSENAVESGVFIAVPMVVLAVLCILIGLYPSFVSGVITAIVKDFVNVPDLKAFSLIAERITFGSSLFLAVFVFASIIHGILYRGKKLDSGPTWDCGYVKGNSRMQYSGSSYAKDIVEFFMPFVGLKEKFYDFKGVFPLKWEYRSEVFDIPESLVVKFMVNPVLILMEKLKWIQSGNIQAYIAYIFAVLAVILVAIEAGVI